ncbi:MAG: endonuclease/exonuclease/phosphatase family protein [Candidatus Peribacteria bacterium]|jgi:endonuclease/exonuclease/phosphatase (EEP) superfamily protein YafD|nr:endonuclease/exonuclease/phosphatase family protein [Candidatus Peribacteria bacterium]
MIFLLLINIGLIVLTLLYFFRESFVAELLISFLPYVAGGLLVLGSILLFLLGKKITTSKANQQPHRRKFEISLLALLAFRSIGMGIHYGGEFFDFYTFGGEQFQQQTLPTQEQAIKIYYANILYTNEDYLSLQQQIEAYEPDVVVLVEFSPHHDTQMKEYFQEKFPYINRNSRSMGLAGDIVFSKYPIKDLSMNYPTPAGKRKYSYFLLETQTPLYFYVVHTSAPVSIKNFQMRNNQLKKLCEEFLLQSTKRTPNASVVMVGDFNLTPWSAFYHTFQQALSGQVVNIFKGTPPTFTRSLRKNMPLVAHIDHVFLSSQLNVSALEVGNLSGSDHNPIMFTVAP